MTSTYNNSKLLISNSGFVLHRLLIANSVVMKCLLLLLRISKQIVTNIHLSSVTYSSNITLGYNISEVIL